MTTENYFTVPFLLLFVMGYWYTGLLSLFQGLFERSKQGDKRLTRHARKALPHGDLALIDASKPGWFAGPRCESVVILT